MNGLGQQRLPYTGFPNDDQRLGIGSELSDPGFEPCDCRTAAYDLGGVQSSGLEEADQVGPQAKAALAAGGLLDSGVSGTRGAI